MKELSKFQLRMMLVMLGSGITMVVTNLIPVISISIGYTLIALVLILLLLECDLSIWYWWVPFRMGYYVTIHHNDYSRLDDEIQLWLKDNIKFKFMYTNDGEKYYFWRNTDAAGFKLRWI